MQPRPPFSPAAWWWARMIVESTIRYSKPGSADIALKIRHQTPLRLQRLNRRNMLFHDPNTSGRSRQGEPVRVRRGLEPMAAHASLHSTTSTNIRLSRPLLPRVHSSPMIWPEIRSHCPLEHTRRSKVPIANLAAKETLKHLSHQRGIPRGHRTWRSLCRLAALAIRARPETASCPPVRRGEACRPGRPCLLRMPRPPAFRRHHAKVPPHPLGRACPESAGCSRVWRGGAPRLGRTCPPCLPRPGRRGTLRTS